MGINCHITDIDNLRHKVTADINPSHPHQASNNDAINNNTHLKTYEDTNPPPPPPPSTAPSKFMGAQPINITGGCHPLLNPIQF